MVSVSIEPAIDMDFDLIIITMQSADKGHLGQMIQVTLNPFCTGLVVDSIRLN